jgi:hypothetical protein
VQLHSMLRLVALLSCLALSDSFTILTPTPGSFRTNPRCGSTACSRSGLRAASSALGHGQPGRDDHAVSHRNSGSVPSSLRHPLLFFSTTNQFRVGSTVKLRMAGAERGVMLSADDDAEAEKLWLEVRCRLRNSFFRM